jgi:hypothetical protein
MSKKDEGANSDEKKVAQKTMSYPSTNKEKKIQRGDG